MTEDTLIHWLSGPNGGLIAIGMLLGGVATWYMNLKIVSPFVQRAHQAEIAAYEAKMQALEAATQRELAALRARVAELESSVSEYHRILKQRAALEAEPN